MSGLASLLLADRNSSPEVLDTCALVARPLLVGGGVKPCSGLGGREARPGRGGAPARGYWCMVCCGPWRNALQNSPARPTPSYTPRQRGTYAGGWHPALAARTHTPQKQPVAKCTLVEPGLDGLPPAFPGTIVEFVYRWFGVRYFVIGLLGDIICLAAGL